jgi:enoyl-CoA hydratase/carnithine racemase
MSAIAIDRRGRVLVARIDAPPLQLISKPAVRAIKRALYEGTTLPLVDGIALESELFRAVAANPQARQGMRRYVERTAATGRLPAYDPVELARLGEGRNASPG